MPARAKPARSRKPAAKAAPKQTGNPPVKRPDCRLYFGMTGSGKSVLWRHQCARDRRLIVWDPELENDKIAVPVSSARALLEAVRSRTFRVAVQLPATVESFEFVNRVALAVGNLTLVWEEAHNMMSAQRLPPVARRLATAGRHSGIKLRVVSQIPKAIHQDIRQNATRIMAFNFREPLQIKYLRDRIGPGAERVADLECYSALDWTNSGLSIKKSPFN